MRFFALLILLLGIQAQAASDSWFIGNTGEVVDTNKGYILRDLYEHNNHENPYFGPSTKPDIAVKIKTRFEHLFFTTNDSNKMETFTKKNTLPLLAIKMTDADKVILGLGDLMIRALNSYSIVFSENSIESDNGKTADGKSILRVADRTMQVIEINLTVWKKMSAEQQAALLFHEAAFSMLRIYCSEDGRCEQSAVAARSLVNDFFVSPGSISRNALIAKIRNVLALPDGFPSCTKQIYNFKFSFFDNQRNIHHKQIQSQNFSGPQYQDLIQKVCASQPWFGVKRWLYIYGAIDTYRPDLETYKSNSTDLSGIKVVNAGVRTNRHFYFEDGHNSCEETLRKSLEGIFKDLTSDFTTCSDKN